MNIAEHFRIQQVERLDLSHYCRIASGSTVAATLERLNETGNNCAFIMQQSRIVGIFTDRDVLRKVVDAPGLWADPIETVMTRTPRTVAAGSTAMDALTLMNGNRFRNVPVMTEDDRVTGNLTHFSLMQLADTLLRNEGALDEEAQSTGYSFSFVNLSGLTADPAVTITSDTSVADTIAAMRDNDIGLITVVDESDRIAGVFSERDILKKVACQVEKLGDVSVGDYMTREPLTLSPKDSVSSALHIMAQNRFRRMVLVRVGGIPVGVVSFRDVAGYIETSFAVQDA